MSEQIAIAQARVDPAGRPLTGRKRQALLSLSILVSWICMMTLIFWATRGESVEVQSGFFWGMAVVSWLTAEAFGGRRALVWPASALAIAGSLSLGFGVGHYLSRAHAPDLIQAITAISTTAAISMAAYLFRFRLPGLISPVITFAIIALFLSVYGVDRSGLAQVEGLSPRGILAALIANPLWMAGFGALSVGAMVLARWLDLNGDDFGVASARPLHLIGAGVTALILGRLLMMLPAPLAIVGLAVLWIAAFAWALRINRVAVVIAVHFAITKPVIVGLDAMMRANSLMTWKPDISDWTLILTGIFVADLVIWFRLHKFWLNRGWILGPGGRIPQPRRGWIWRYWPYA